MAKDKTSKASGDPPKCRKIQKRSKQSQSSSDDSISGEENSFSSVRRGRPRTSSDQFRSEGKRGSSQFEAMQMAIVDYYHNCKRPKASVLTAALRETLNEKREKDPRFSMFYFNKHHQWNEENEKAKAESEINRCLLYRSLERLSLSGHYERERIRKVLGETVKFVLESSALYCDEITGEYYKFTRNLVDKVYECEINPLTLEQKKEECYARVGEEMFEDQKDFVFLNFRFLEKTSEKIKSAEELSKCKGEAAAFAVALAKNLEFFLKSLINFDKVRMLVTSDPGDQQHAEDIGGLY